jgi:ABC-type glycerol-3-phosphate transport system substrate-binding protein
MISEAKQKLDEIISVLSENKLKEVIDFASYLRSKEETEELLGMQIGSKAYIDWLSSENDIYDEVFSDEIKQR